MRVAAIGTPTLTLHSGATFDFRDPRSSDFTIEDIAHGLSHICRYAGQCRAFYSVAEHSVYVSGLAAGSERHGLLHDAAEAFIGDVPSPIKQGLSEYRAIEREIQHVIFARFGIPSDMPDAVKIAEKAVLAAEQRQIMPQGTDDWARLSGIKYADIVVAHLSPPEAKHVFLQRFNSLFLSRRSLA